MRQQEGVDDDNQQLQLHRCDCEEVDHKGSSHKEVDNYYEEVFDQEEDGRRGVTICLTDSYSLTAKFAAVEGEYSRRGWT